MEKLLEDIYSDISFNKVDLDNLKDSTNNYINSELKKINVYLMESVKEFCKGEVENNETKEN